MRTKRLRALWAATVFGLMATWTGQKASADQVFNFNFEEQSVGNSTTITSTQSGLTASISRLDGQAIGISNLSSFGVPSTFGARTIGNFVSSFTAPGGTLVINFSQAVSIASLQFGDFGGDDDSPVVLSGFSGLNGTGSLLNSATTSYDATMDLRNGNVGSLSVAATGIESLEFSSGGTSSTFPNSLYVDNLSATIVTALAVPEPSTIVLVSTGMISLLGYRLLHRKAKTDA